MGTNGKIVGKVNAGRDSCYAVCCKERRNKKEPVPCSDPLLVLAPQYAQDTATEATIKARRGVAIVQKINMFVRQKVSQSKLDVSVLMGRERICHALPFMLGWP